MSDTYAFLDLLGLDETADARAIRRAYARQLKQLDQARDPAGFQALREAYETALDWAAYMAQEGGREQAATPPAAPPPAQADDAATPAGAQSTIEATEPAAPDIPEEVKLAAIVWERFEAGMEQLAHEQRLPDPEAWHALLLARLQDDELVNIGAHTQFEWRIVCMLGSGWRPGHEALFPAAVAAFGWAQDRRRLAMFAYYGNLVNAAIDERAVFDSQAVAVRSVQDRVAMLLRREKQADRRDIVNSMGELRTMQQCFPALLLVVTNPDNVAHWEAEFAALELVPSGEPSPYDKPARWFVKIMIVVIAFASLQAVYEYRSPPVSEFVPEQVPAHLVQPSAEPPMLLAENVPSLRYQPPENGALRELSVAYDVFLAADGGVEFLRKRSGSDDIAFDEAAEEALRLAKPFPKGTAPVFGVVFIGQIVETKRPGALLGTRSLRLLRIVVSPAEDSKSAHATGS